jgi:hypothetical protein
MHAAVQRHSSSHVNFAPFHSTDQHTTFDPVLITTTRDFVLCEDLPNSEGELEQIVDKALRNAEALPRKIETMSWKTYQNFMTSSGLDYNTVKSNSSFTSPALNTSFPPAHIGATAIFDGGSFSVHLFPRLQLAHASVTNLNNHVAHREIYETLLVSLDPDRVTGVDFGGFTPIIPLSGVDNRLSHFGDEAIGSISHWQVADPYWSSPKIQLRTSPIAGMGNVAREVIKKGELVFGGPIEMSLMHLEEYERYPDWMKQYIDHYAEQAEEFVLVAPSRGQEDLRFSILLFNFSLG